MGCPGKSQFFIYLVVLTIAAGCFQNETTTRPVNGQPGAGGPSETPKETPKPSVDGGIISSGGGGDPIRFAFKEGVLEVTAIVKSIKPEHYIPGKASPSEKWIMSMIPEISRELSSLDVCWLGDEDCTYEEADRQSTCAHTEYRRNAKIFLKMDLCRGLIYSKQDAGKVLAHEVAHHLGITDHNFADDIGLAIYRTWEKLKLKHTPVCVPRNQLLSTLPGTWRLNITLSRELTDQRLTEYQFTLTEDFSVLNDMPAFGTCAHLAGYLTHTDRNPGPHPYFISQDGKGDYRIYMWETRPGEKPHMEHVRISVAKADKKNRERDLFFVGGDYEEPFLPYQRIK